MNDYTTFLASKHITAERMGFDVPIEAIHPRLMPHSRDTVRWALRLGRAAIFANVGLHKTSMQLEWAKHVAAHTGKKVLILAPLAVAHQTVKEGLEQGITVKQVREFDDIGDNQIVITNYDRVHKFYTLRSSTLDESQPPDMLDPAVFSSIVLDECFAPNTPIDVLSNNKIVQKPISEVRQGDLLLNASGVDTVADVHRREIPYAIKVRFAGKSVIASPNHPWLTQRGWVGSQDLEPGDYLLQTAEAMRLVRNDIHSQISEPQISTLLRKIMLSEMAYESTGTCCQSSYSRSEAEAGESQKSMVSFWERSRTQGEETDYATQANGKPRNTSKTLPHIESHEAQTFRAWGKWDWIDETTIRDAKGTRQWLGGGIQFITGKTNSRLSDALQSRLGERRAQSSYRGGWSLAQIAEGAGPEEGCETGFIRLDSIEILELGHPELDQFRDASGKLYFYDIGATRHPSFSINGILVHNSSILKHYSQTFFELCKAVKELSFRLCCTATPSPNDTVELGNHSTFLGVMDFHDMLAQFFVGEGKVARHARLAGHAEEDFYEWLTSWAVCISHPSDLGEEYDRPGFILPPMEIHEHRLGLNAISIERAQSKGRLFPDTAVSATGFQQVKRDSLDERISKVKEIVESIPADEPIIIWCDTNLEADALIAAFPGKFHIFKNKQEVEASDSVELVEVRGSQDPDQKEAGLIAFSSRKARMIITKAEIAGFGLNWQHCCHMIFIGSSFSFELPYQAIGRILRFGQKRPVHIDWIYADTEGSVMQTFKEKQAAFGELQTNMNAAMKKHGLFRDGHPDMVFAEAEYDLQEGANWKLYLGDCVVNTEHLADNSVHLVVTSIPFGESMYTYSDKKADMGNAANRAEFMKHFNFLLKEIMRVLAPGRVAAFHVKDLPLFINRDGAMGIDTFSDDVMMTLKKAGFVPQSRITVGKDPVMEMQKTNSHGLLYKNWREKAQILRVGLPDYVLIVRKWPAEVNATDLIHDPRDITYFGQEPPPMLMDIPGRGKDSYKTSLPVWQRYANPIWDDVSIPAIWTDIEVTKVLNYLVAKEDRDQRHICPLQLDLISRLIHWYTNPGESVLDPFAGIGSTVYEAVKLGRVGIGMELKPSYFNLALKYVQQAQRMAGQKTLFDWADEQRSEEFNQQVYHTAAEILAEDQAANS